jgi:hypothetical protein
MSLIPVQDYMAEILGAFEAGKPLENQRERDRRAFEEWEAQPEPEGEDET